MTSSGHYDPDDPFVEALFAAGRDEVPAARAMEKTLVAIGAAAATLPIAVVAEASVSMLPKATAAALGGKAAASVPWLMFAKWTGIGLGAGLATVAAAEGATHFIAPKTAASTAVAARLAPPQTEPALRSRNIEPLAKAPELPRAPAARAAFPEAKPDPAPDKVDGLHRELTQVDTARAALSGGRSRQALLDSQQYEHDHPHGRLLPEALLIRMRAFEQVGDHHQARAVARRLIRIAPTSPHAAQARSLLHAAGEIP